MTIHTDEEGLRAARASVPSGEPIADESAALELSQRQRTRLVAAVTLHQQLLWRTLRRFGVPERDIDDAAQRVFLAFAERMSRVDAGKEASFLVGVAVRVAANARRKNARSLEDLSDQAESVPAPYNPEGLLDQKQLREELDRGLMTLSLEHRAVFVLFELEGFSVPEIAETLQIPLGTAMSRLGRARLRFEAWVKERGKVAGDEP